MSPVSPPSSRLGLGSACALASAVILTACMDSEDRGPRGGEDGKIKAVTRMVSTTLKPAAKVSAVRAVERCDYGYPCLTPDGFVGRVYSGNFMVGGNGGAPGVPLRIVEGYDTSYHGPETGRGGKATFDLKTVTDLGGSYNCCSGSYPADEAAVVKRLEFTFDYLDVTFTIPSDVASPLQGKTYTIRTVYVDSGSAEDLPAGDKNLVMGDKLLKRQGETGFTWCAADACGETKRPASPIQAAWLADAAFLGAYEHYAQVALVLKNPMGFTRDEALNGKWRFTADFDLTRAAVFQIGDLALLDTEAKLVKAFEMYARDGGPGAIGVRVNLTKTRLDSASAAL